MKLKTGVLILLLACFFFVKAQEPVLVIGEITDAITNEHLAFVNIGIEGTLLGTASNADGAFTFKVPLEYAEKDLYFSTIGYQNLTIPLQQFLLQKKTIQLQPLSYGINDVEISTRSKVPYRIVRETAQAIPEKYLHQPYSLHALYQNEVYINQTLGKKRDAMVLISDAEGYGVGKTAFRNINYQFINVQRNFEVKSLNDGTTLMDEMLSLDFARNNGNVLDPVFLNDYDLDLVENTTLNGDSVWVIAYQLAQPNVSHTGDLNANFCQGKLYISKSKGALLKAESHLKAPVQSSQGRTIAVENNRAIKEVDYWFITNYKTFGNVLVLDRITLNKSFTSETGESTKIKTSLLVVEVNTTNPQMLNNRQYFENLTSDPDFWATDQQ